MKIDIATVAEDKIRFIYPAVRELIERACEASLGRDSPAKVLEDLAVSRKQLWIVADTDEETILGIVITEVAETEDGTVVSVPLMAGHDYKLWVDKVDFLEYFALKINAVRIETWARPGSAKLLREQGFREARRLMIKEIDSKLH